MIEPETADLNIRQMRARFNVTARTLRYYEQLDLLSPVRTDTRDKIFTKREIERMKLIQKWQRFGFTLTEIWELLSLYRKGTPNKKQQTAVIKLAKEKRAGIVSQRDQLTRSIVEIDAFTVKVGV